MIANTFLENNKIINIIFNYIFRLTLFFKNVFASTNIIYNQCYSLYVQYSQLFPPLAAKLALHQGFIVIHFQFLLISIKIFQRKAWSRLVLLETRGWINIKFHFTKRNNSREEATLFGLSKCFCESCNILADPSTNMV